MAWIGPSLPLIDGMDGRVIAVRYPCDLVLIVVSVGREVSNQIEHREN